MIDKLRTVRERINYCIEMRETPNATALMGWRELIDEYLAVPRCPKCGTTGCA